MEITLKIYKTPAGQWAGIFLEDNVEIGRISGCSSSSEVVIQAIDQGYAKFTVQIDI
jgi:hypothetical protein